jgi:ribosomal subunit interface protein
MEVRISARHTTLPASLTTRATEVLSKLTKFDSRVSTVDVVFVEENRSFKAEGIVHIDRSEPIVASGDAEDFNSALTQLYDRLVSQLRRHHEQSRDHQAPKLTETLSQE